MNMTICDTYSVFTKEKKLNKKDWFESTSYQLSAFALFPTFSKAESGDCERSFPLFASQHQFFLLPSCPVLYYSPVIISSRTEFI